MKWPEESENSQPVCAPPSPSAGSSPPMRSEKKRPLEDPLPYGATELAFEVSLAREDGASWGIDVSSQEAREPSRLIVTGIKPGPVFEHNRQSQDCAIMLGDYIVEVNGNSGLAAPQLIEVIRDSQHMTLRILRVLEHRVTLHKVGKLGVDIACHANCLRVVSIAEGPLADWNAKHEVDLQVFIHDFIFEVNGSRGTCHELIKLIGGSGADIELLVVRGGANRRPGFGRPGRTAAAARVRDAAGPPGDDAGHAPLCAVAPPRGGGSANSLARSPHRVSADGRASIPDVAARSIAPPAGCAGIALSSPAEPHEDLRNLAGTSSGWDDSVHEGLMDVV